MKDKFWNRKTRMLKKKLVKKYWVNDMPNSNKGNKNNKAKTRPSPFKKWKYSKKRN